MVATERQVNATTTAATFAVVAANAHEAIELVEEPVREGGLFVVCRASAVSPDLVRALRLAPREPRIIQARALRDPGPIRPRSCSTSSPAANGFGPTGRDLETER